MPVSTAAANYMGVKLWVRKYTSSITIKPNTIDKNNKR